MVIYMVFGKDQNSDFEGLKGRISQEVTNIRKSEFYSESVSRGLKEKWKDPKFRKKMEKILKDARSRVDLSEAGKKSHYYENKIAKTIVADKIYKPSEVCDRIVVRNSKIYFVEIKRKGQRLRKKQEEFSKIVGKQYEIIYG